MGSWILTHCVFQMFVCFSRRVGLKKKSFVLKFQFDSCISPQECLKSCFESFLKGVGVKKSVLICFEIRASIYESSTYPKEFGCVNILKIVPSHHWEVGSTTVGGVRVNSMVRDIVVTRAMGRHLRSYPYAIDHGHKDLLKRPILDDHVSKEATGEAYPKSGMCEWVRSQLCYLYACYDELQLILF